MKMNTVSNTPANKEQLDDRDYKTWTNSPPEHATQRANIFIDKNSKNKIAMVGFGNTKLMNKGQRNSCLKPPKKCYTINSNRNSDSDSSFTSLGQLGFKNGGQENITPHHVVRGSFEIRSTADFLNNTEQIHHRKPENTYEGFNQMFNATLDVRECNANDLLDKSMI